VLFKYYALFCEHFGLEPATAVIYKPLMARVLMGFGFEPQETSCRVIIHNGPERERIIEVFPVGFNLEPRLLVSQNMVVLTQIPDLDDSSNVFVNTHFRLPQRREAFWEVVSQLPGRYFLYRSEQAPGVDAISDLPPNSDEHLPDYESGLALGCRGFNE
jgi:hypothetical protein